MWLICVLGEGDKLQNRKEWEDIWSTSVGKLWYHDTLKISSILHFEALEEGKCNLL